jgi:phosphoglycerol transferase MdoB-like AlkP superfamily enzyme
MLVPKFRTFPSAVEMFNRMGHTTLAIHPFRPNIYRRDRVYPILGFSDFISQTDMDHHLKFENNPYISDGAAFRQVLDAIDSHEKPVFVNLVTMQNHTPYAGKYADPIPVEGLDQDDAEMLGQYSRGLTYTDRAIAGFVRALDHSDEKTVVVLYGDHLPAGTPGALWDDNTDRAMHETPFFIYANFGKVKPEELSTTSPIFFLPEVFDLAGAPLPPYYMLLHELHRSVPAMEHGRIVDADNRVVTREELSPRARHLLDDYRLVQYDLSVGKRYAEKMFYPTPTATVAASGAAE